MPEPLVRPKTIDRKGVATEMNLEAESAPARAKKARPGGRTERVRKAVADAVITLIQREGIQFEIQAVARLSGVGRATIFRRWPDRASLIGEALAEHTSKFEVTITGDWEGDLRRIAADLRKFFSQPAEKAFNRTLFASNSRDFNLQMIKYWQPIINKIMAPLEAARLMGEIIEEANILVIVQAMTCTFVVESLVSDFETDGDLGELLIDQFLRGLRKNANLTPSSGKPASAQSHERPTTSAAGGRRLAGRAVAPAAARPGSS